MSEQSLGSPGGREGCAGLALGVAGGSGVLLELALLHADGHLQVAHHRLLVAAGLDVEARPLGRGQAALAVLHCSN